MQIRLGSSAAASALGLIDDTAVNGKESDGSSVTSGYIQSSIESGIVSGFQLATANGPLCDEPMWGTVFEVYLFQPMPLPAIFKMHVYLTSPQTDENLQAIRLQRMSRPDWVLALSQ